MPKQTDTKAELDAIKEALGGGQKARRQYAARFDLTTCKALFEDCVRMDKIPSTLISEIVTGYYEKRGLVTELEFSTQEAAVLDRIAGFLKTDRAGVVKRVLGDHLLETLSALSNRAKQFQAALDSLEGA